MLFRITFAFEATSWAGSIARTACGGLATRKIASSESKDASTPGHWRCHILFGDGLMGDEVQLGADGSHRSSADKNIASIPFICFRSDTQTE